MSPDIIVAVVTGVIIPFVTLYLGVVWGKRIEQHRDCELNQEKFKVWLWLGMNREREQTTNAVHNHVVATLSFVYLGRTPAYIRSIRLISDRDIDGSSWFYSFDGNRIIQIQHNEPFESEIKIQIHEIMKEIDDRLGAVRRVFSPESTIEITTSRGRYNYPVTEVCSTFDLWPDIVSEAVTFG